MSHGPCGRGGAAAAVENIINVTPANASAPATIPARSILVFMFILFVLPCRVYPGTGVLPFLRILPRPELALPDRAKHPWSLLRQRLASVYLERCVHRRCSCVRLAAADRDRVTALRNDRIPSLGDHHQVAVLQLKLDLLRLARLEVNSLEAAQSTQRGPGDVGEGEVDLSDLVTLTVSGIGDGGSGDQQIARVDCGLGRGELAVGKLRVAEAIAERIKRLAL